MVNIKILKNIHPLSLPRKTKFFKLVGLALLGKRLSFMLVKSNQVNQG
jgi:hypothetical protein